MDPAGIAVLVPYSNPVGYRSHPWKLARSPDGLPSRSRVSALRTGDDGAVGLCWGARRDLFTDGPGLFELSIVGGGDSIFGRGLLDHTAMPSVPWLRTHRPMLERTWSRR